MRGEDGTYEQYRVVLQAEHAKGASFMQTSQKAYPQRSSSRAWGGSGMNMAARVMMTIAPASVDIDKSNMAEVLVQKLSESGGGGGSVVVHNRPNTRRPLASSSFRRVGHTYVTV